MMTSLFDWMRSFSTNAEGYRPSNHRMNRIFRHRSLSENHTLDREDSHPSLYLQESATELVDEASAQYAARHYTNLCCLGETLKSVSPDEVTDHVSTLADLKSALRELSPPSEVRIQDLMASCTQLDLIHTSKQTSPDLKSGPNDLATCLRMGVLGNETENYAAARIDGFISPLLEFVGTATADMPVLDVSSPLISLGWLCEARFGVLSHNMRRLWSMAEMVADLPQEGTLGQDVSESLVDWASNGGAKVVYT